LICAGIAALAIGFALGLRALPVVSVSETIRPKNPEPWVAVESPIPNSRGLRVASLDARVFLEPVVEDREPELTTSSTGRLSSAGVLAIDARAASFAERFMGGSDRPDSREPADLMLWPSADPGRPAAQRAVRPPARGAAPLPPMRPASLSKKPVRVAEAPAADDASTPSDPDSHTAIYDIVAHKVYLPNGQRLEAHSGLGSYLDDPRRVSEKDRGPTPPNVYDLALREEPFHGVRALRLIPVGSGDMFGRDGILAHSYMLGPNGQSNGCVSFSDYPAFLNAVLSGEVTRLVVVEHLANVPSSKTAFGWLPDTIKALLGRS
jgi:hypothetical protein